MRRAPMSRQARPLGRRTPLRQAKPRVTESAHKSQWPVSTASPGRKASGAKPFPPAVAALLDERDPYCQRCGSPRDLERHHRRAKAIGGSQRDHAQCACCGVRLCRACHQWAHSHPEQSRAEGWIVSQSADFPGEHAVMRFSAGDGGATMWPTCDGQWSVHPPEVAA